MNPLQWRNCPACNASLVDAEISEQIAQFCEKGAFHSRLLGGWNSETDRVEYWKCPDCQAVFTNDNQPVIHTMSDVYLSSS